MRYVTLRYYSDHSGSDSVASVLIESEIRCWCVLDSWIIILLLPFVFCVPVAAAAAVAISDLFHRWKLASFGFVSFRVVDSIETYESQSLNVIPIGSGWFQYCTCVLPLLRTTTYLQSTSYKYRYTENMTK